MARRRGWGVKGAVAKVEWQRSGSEAKAITQR